MNNIAKSRPKRPGLLYRLMMSFLGLFDRLLHLSCRAFIRLASEKYERPLLPGEKRRQSIHRAMCRMCRIQEQRMDQLRLLARDIGRTSAEELEVSLSAEAKDRIRNAVVSASVPSKRSE